MLLEDAKVPASWQLGHPMKDYKSSLEKLRTEATEAALIRDLATDPAKRDVFDRLAQHLSALADQVEHAMREQSASDSTGTNHPAPA